MIAHNTARSAIHNLSLGVFHNSRSTTIATITEKRDATFCSTNTRRSLFHVRQEMADQRSAVPIQGDVSNNKTETPVSKNVDFPVQFAPQTTTANNVQRESPETAHNAQSYNGTTMGNFEELAVLLFPKPFRSNSVVPKNEASTEFRTIMTEKVFPRLRAFGYNPGYITDKRPIEESLRPKKDSDAKRHPKHWSDSFKYMEARAKRKGSYYCQSCLRIGKTEREFSMCKIADYSYENALDSDDRVKAQIRITRVYPHNSECCKAREERRRHVIRLGNGSSAVAKWRFCFNRVIGSTYNELLNKMHTFDDPDVALPPGTPVTNGIDNYPFDDLTITDLPSISPKEYSDVLDPKNHHRAMLRLCLWFSNTFNLTEDIWPVKMFFRKEIWSPHTVEYPHTTESARDPDKQLTHASLIFGGHGRKAKHNEHSTNRCLSENERDQLVDQTQHYTFPKNLTKEDTIGCSRNPGIDERSDVGTLVVPLKHSRSFYINSPKNVVSVKKGEILWIGGNTPCGSKSYIKSNPVRYCPALVLHLESNFHRHVRWGFSRDVSSATYMPVQHIGLLPPHEQCHLAQHDVFDKLSALLAGDNEDLKARFDDIVCDYITQERDKGRTANAIKSLTLWCKAIGCEINNRNEENESEEVESREQDANTKK